MRKTFDIVSDATTDEVVCWSTEGTSFLILHEHDFQKEVLPKYFKHDNLCSFIRQLNTYGFRKVSVSKDSFGRPNVLEFEQPFFVRDQPDLLSHLKRKQKKKDEPPDAFEISEPPEPIDTVTFATEDDKDGGTDRCRMAATLNTLIKKQQDTEKSIAILWSELTEAKRVIQQLQNKKRPRDEDHPSNAPLPKLLKQEDTDESDCASSDNEEGDEVKAAQNMARLLHTPKPSL